MNEGPQTLTLPLLPTRSFVLFPATIQPIEAGRAFSINAIRAAHLQADSLLFVACQKNPNDETIDFDKQSLDIVIIVKQPFLGKTFDDNKSSVN